MLVLLSVSVAFSMDVMALLFRIVLLSIELVLRYDPWLVLLWAVLLSAIVLVITLCADVASVSVLFVITLELVADAVNVLLVMLEFTAVVPDVMFAPVAFVPSSVLLLMLELMVAVAPDSVLFHRLLSFELMP